jgi:hypothetical protein
VFDHEVEFDAGALGHLAQQLVRRHGRYAVSFHQNSGSLLFAGSMRTTEPPGQSGCTHAHHSSAVAWRVQTSRKSNLIVVIVWGGTHHVPLVRSAGFGFTNDHPE